MAETSGKKLRGWLLLALSDLDGAARRRQVHQRVEDRFGNEFTSEDRAPRVGRAGGEPAWRNNLDSLYDRLKKDGVLLQTQRAGEPWRLSAAGEAEASGLAPMEGFAAIPAEATTGAADLLRRLVGVPIRTVTGRTNTILGFQPPNVLVATDRSPGGQSVPIAGVDDALEQLLKQGSVEIHPDAVGHRSAFIGAVLLTLPGANAVGSPPVITFQQPTASGHPVTGEDLTFEGDLTRPYEGAQRGEQGWLRRVLFGPATEAQCGLCGEIYPVRFLWAAHIKKRAVCTDEERRDLQHIAMPACLFGCDALFEAGYVSVDDTGHLIVSDEPGATRLAERLAQLSGRHVIAHTDGSAAYFAWHRINSFRQSFAS